MSSSSSPQEETTAPTRLDWSDDDDFFGEDDDNDDDNDDDEKIESFDGEWDESFGVDDDLNSSARQVEQDETSNDDYDDDELVEPGIAENETDSDNDDDVDDDDDSEQSEVSDGIAEETPEKTTATVATDDEHEQEEEKEHEHEIIGEAVASDGGDGASPTDADNTALNPAPILKLAQRTSSPNRVSSGGKPPLATDNGIFERVPRSPNIMSSIFGDGAGIVGASSVGLGSPFSLNETPGTPLPFVELDGEDEKFEEIVRKRNRVRKEREDYHIAHIKVQMGRLEDALAAETKRRVDATTALDELARTQVHEMEERVREQLREENERLQHRLGALEERVRRLDENWAIDAKHQIETVNNKAHDLGMAVSRIQEDQDMERKSRLKREGVLLRQVEDYAKETDDRWKAERKDRVERLKELEGSILRNEARLALEQKRYEDRLETELTQLKKELAVEIDERQTQDEQIVAAMNRYTQQLQQSLSILSSD